MLDDAKPVAGITPNWVLETVKSPKASSMTQAEPAIAQLDAIRDLGVALSIDDFGAPVIRR
ncbi:hypothetical protein [Thiorhodococcus drewsii]|uniref:hypothetical protein n=1 Tax=Thiorhodococcus drewsii TaxID=210408 RepID=UPI0002EBC7E4|nr:hypothetical protein [Thiorhodococcus drewsii]